MNLPLIESLGLDLTGGSSLDILASKIMLGEELSHLKSQLSYQGIGRRTIGERASVPHSNWEKFCRFEAGISDRSMRTYQKWGEVLARRLRLCGNQTLLELMARQPSTLPPQQRKKMIQDIVRLALLPGDSAESLSKEFQTSAPEQPRSGETNDIDAHTLAEDQDPVAKIEALARAAGVSEKNVRRVAMIVRDNMLSTARKIKLAELAVHAWNLRESCKLPENGHHKS